MRLTDGLADERIKAPMVSIRVFVISQLSAQDTGALARAGLSRVCFRLVR